MFETTLTMRRVSEILLIGSFVLHLVGVFMFNGRNVWFAETRAYLNWERGLFMAAFLVSALGVSLLEIVLREIDASALVAVLARLGATAFLIGATVAIVTEAASISGQSSVGALLVVMVVVLFVAEAILGGALLRSGILPAWVGWTVVVWNIGWLVVLPIVSPRDIYYPVLHFIPLLPVGITALVARYPVNQIVSAEGPPLSPGSADH